MPSTGDPSAAAPVGSAPSLADVLPSVARSLGVVRGTPRAGGDRAASDGFAFPAHPPGGRRAHRRAGARPPVRRAGHAPWLRSRLASTQRVASGFPSTTATSMGTFGTGLAAGAHGLLGYEVLVPGRDRLNELSWEDGPDPRLWQPHGTVFEAVERDGVEVAHRPGVLRRVGADHGGPARRPVRRRDLLGGPGRRRPHRGRARCAAHLGAPVLG